ncbi:MAG: methionyl-tRNA formyltransferase [Clostridium sp. CAG:354_28_25]|nr:MAG: methionyl-tRNA formyltransferase [Clostridium sp. CAG:354_28_25]
MLKILFMGTPDFAQESLKSIYDAGFEIIGVVTNPDKPKGRGMKLAYSPVKEYALEKNLKIYQPIKIRNNTEFLDEIRTLAPDVICVVAYGKILPKEILEIPKLGCINVHGSLLPKYRGAAPIQWAVLNGEKITGITTMYMNEGMDTGDMILKEEVEIGPEETTGDLWQKLTKIGGEILVKTLKLIEEGKAPREKQTEEATLAPMLNKEMALIDWENSDANKIHNLIRGLNPIMGAYSYIDGKKIKFWKSKVLTKEEFFSYKTEFEEYEAKFNNLVPGTILIADDKDGLYIKANGGVLKILEIQGENAKRMPTADFLRGNHLIAGMIFSKEI